MPYVDGFMCAVATTDRELYRFHAGRAAVLFRNNGALSVVECWGDDVPEGKVNSMRSAVMCKEDETVVFSWVMWPSKEVRDKGMAGVMRELEAQSDDNRMPFDGQRMIFGGFEVIVQV